MRNIPIAAVPNQSLSVRLDNERLVLRLKEANGVMVADLDRDGVRVLSSTRVLAGEPIIPYEYLESGNFILLTLRDELPEWRQFNATQSLIYVSRVEVEAILLLPQVPLLAPLPWVFPSSRVVTYLGEVVTYLGNPVTYQG